MKLENLSIIPASVRLRQATLQDVIGILALKQRIKGVSLPWNEEELRSQISSFPEGQVIAESARTRQIIGALGTLVIARSGYSLFSRWSDLTAEGTFKNHDPEHGKTLFRSHLIVDPKYDNREMRDLLSQAELVIAKIFNMDRIRAGVRFRDYYLFHHLAPAEYLREVEVGLISDSWLTQVFNRGFKPLAVVSRYYPQDWRSDGYAVVAQLDLRADPSQSASTSENQKVFHFDRYSELAQNL